MATVLLLSTSDTDLMGARATGCDYVFANPSRLIDGELDTLLAQADVVVVRILGGVRAWETGISAVRASGVPTVLVSGELSADAELMANSTVPIGVAAQVHDYLAFGGSANLRSLHGFLSDTVLFTGDIFDPPAPTPTWGSIPFDAAQEIAAGAPVIGIVCYRSQFLAGNTAYITALCEAIVQRGGRPVPLFCASLRQAPAELLDQLRGLDALIVTVLAAGGTTPAEVGAGGDDEAWNVEHLAALDIPILQGLCLTSSRATWEASDDGVSPLDVATQVAVPEFDGRIITVPFSFKEISSDGLPAYVPDPERCLRVAGIAVAHGRLRGIDLADRKVAVLLSAYPTKHARIGNAVGLDTPASVLALLHALHDAGYDLGTTAEIPGYDAWTPVTAAASGADGTPAGDALMHALIAAGGQDPDWLTEEALAANPFRLPGERYTQWFGTVDRTLRQSVEAAWGAAPGELFTDAGDIVVSALRFGNVLIMVQPPRGFGENPVAIYHDPDLAPSHHYLGSYHWVANREYGFGADAIVHVGKHGNLEWLPGKTLGMSASCGTDAALGDLPLFYPFLVNDPGEGTQAKRRAHAVLIDHLVPPMARAESYGDIAKLEQLLDEHAQISALDPAKLPAIRQQIWTLLQSAQLDKDLGLSDRPDEEVFDDMLLHVDGWLCEIKDVQIRDGLHVLGAPPTGEAEIDLVLAMLRARQLWSGQQTLPGLREALGLAEDADRAATDAAETRAKELLTTLAAADWDPTIISTLAVESPPVADILRFAATEVVPRLRRTTEEISQIVRALDGRFIAAGPSGSPLRGLINVLPTGRNFYSVDPKAIPSALAWDTGRLLADSLIERYRTDNAGEYPRSVGLSIWGTSAMRTSGDDIAEVLALLGVSPQWDAASRRVTGFEVLSLEELGRPRIDVTLRISGFFRDAFGHVVTMLDDAIRAVAALDEPAEQNFVAAHVRAEIENGATEFDAATRIFGSKPGSYGAGLLQLIDSKQWRSDADLAEVYTTWGGYAYGRARHGEPATEQMRAAYRRIAIAAKNTDTREHDIADSDDYFQYHGGMVATVRALTGQDPQAYIGDSTRPEAVRTRTLHEETSRIFRARVVNPRWMAAMRRHGYKGAFEMAATVDYLFGYDATTNVVEDWMYGELTERYVVDAENREFLQRSNPWALHGIAERLLEAAQRELWQAPPPELLAELRKALLEAENDIEGR